LAELLPSLELAARLLGYLVERVDLAVRMLDRRPDLGAAILEDQDVRDLVGRAEGPAALRPEVDHLARPLGAERPEGRVVVGRVEDHLAAVVRHRRPAVAEPANVVFLRSFEAAGAEGADRRGQVGPHLARAHDVGALAAVDVDPEIGAVVRPPSVSIRRINVAYLNILDQLRSIGHRKT